MNRRYVLKVLAVMPMVGALGRAYAEMATGDAFELISNAEYQASLDGQAQSGDLPMPKTLKFADPDAPTIDILRPDHGAPIESPVGIEVRFQSQDEADIDLSTLRIGYGFFNIDITERVLAHAEVDATGIRADNAEMPAGEHTIHMEVADTKGRKGETEVSFEVI